MTDDTDDDHYVCELQDQRDALLKERDQLRARVNDYERRLIAVAPLEFCITYTGDAVQYVESNFWAMHQQIDQLRSELDAAKRREVAMCEALEFCEQEAHRPDCDRMVIYTKCEEALSNAPTPDLLTKKQVKPLVEALRFYKSCMWVDFTTGTEVDVKALRDDCGNRAKQALGHAKSLGL